VAAAEPKFTDDLMGAALGAEAAAVSVAGAAAATVSVSAV